MAEFKPSEATTGGLTEVENFSVNSKSLDYTNMQGGETEWYFSEAAQNFGYYFEIPELKKAIDALATWTTGRGWEAEDGLTKQDLEHLSGWGEDTFHSIMWNMIVTKKVVGDAFAEIIRRDNILVNLKPISPERVKLVLSNNGRIKRYEVLDGNNVWKSIERKNMLHISNDRVGDQIHGTSVIDACKWVIDARNEALTDERKIKHRDLGLGIMYVKTDKASKIAAVKTKLKKAIEDVDMLILPEDVAEIRDTGVSPKDRLAWIQYLENFFYQAVGVPKIILGGADQHTEAGGKVGYLTFEPVYVHEQTQLEADLWNQLAIKIKFNRPASLGGTIQQDEAKNTGQLGFQPNDMTATTTRE